MSEIDPRLESLLRQLPDGMAFPPTPDIAGRVSAALPDRRPSRARRISPWLFGALAAAAILLVVTLPAPREAIADFLGLPGIRIELVDRHGSDEPPTSIGSSLLFGTRTTPGEAQAQVPFTILAPDGAGLPEPDEVWLRTADGVSAVSLVYGVRDDLPEIGDTGVGMLLMQFQATDEVPFLAKRASMTGPLTSVTVNGQSGFWIANGELVVLPPGLESTRRSGNVLLWEDDGVTFRMESALGMTTAIGIAESLQPITGQGKGNQLDVAVVGEVTTSRTASRRSHHESPSLPCRHARRTARPSCLSRPRRRLGVDPAGGAVATALRRRALRAHVHHPWA